MDKANKYGAMAQRTMEPGKMATNMATESVTWLAMNKTTSKT